MEVEKITFDDKVSVRSSELPAVNKLRDVDINEIKKAVNDNADLLEFILPKDFAVFYVDGSEISKVKGGFDDLLFEVDFDNINITSDGFDFDQFDPQQFSVEVLPNDSNFGSFDFEVESDNLIITAYDLQGNVSLELFDGAFIKITQYA